jgi:hypothetical protein
VSNLPHKIVSERIKDDPDGPTYTFYTVPVRRRRSLKPRLSPAAPELRERAMRQTPLEVLEIVNRLYLLLDDACGLYPHFAVTLEEKISMTDRELLLKLEQHSRLYPEAVSGTGSDGRQIQRTTSIVTGLAVTTHLLQMLRFAFRRAHRRIKRAEAKAQRAA